MLYVLYNPDGSIHQCNKLYDHNTTGKYDELMNDLGHTFVKDEQLPGLLPPEHFMVHTGLKEIQERPVMNISVSKTRILCGDKDSALLTGCPNKASVQIFSSGYAIYPAFTLDATELEISIPVPCIYKVMIDCWPYKTFIATIEAVLS